MTRPEIESIISRIEKEGITTDMLRPLRFPLDTWLKYAQLTPENCKKIDQTVVDKLKALLR